MRIFLELALASAVLICNLNVMAAQSTDKEGHRLVSEWAMYYEAESRDKPKDQEKILLDIKEKALKASYAYDYYDAGVKLVSVKSSMNWKLNWPSEQERRADLLANGAPVAVVFNRSCMEVKDFAAYVNANADVLKASRNDAFYGKDTDLPSPYRSALLDMISNDYEYALWALYGWDGKKYRDGIVSYYGDRYPEAALIEYTDGADPELFSKKYEGRAVAMLALQDLLQKRFDKLEKARCNDESEYRKLFEDCRAFNESRREFSGNEQKLALCCKKAESLCETLKTESLWAEAHGRELTVFMKNLKSARVKISKDGKNVHETKAVDGKCRFYVADTVKVDIPELDDNEYQIELRYGKDGVYELAYRKYTLSIASRIDSDGTGVFVADYMSGKPVGRCTVELYESAKKTASAEVNVTDGYAKLPENMQKKLSGNKWYYSVQAVMKTPDGRTARSERLSVHNLSISKPVNTDDARGLVITDRGAFNPGESVRFKAVLYRGVYSYETVAAGEQAVVRLLDSEDKKVSELKLSTNEFGAVAGAFVLEKGHRGGVWSVELEYGKDVLARQRITVDEFVLPTFNLKWDEPGQIYLAGDEIPVSGKVSSYSGHSTASAKAVYEVSRYGRVVNTGELKLEGDGSFRFSFPSDSLYSNYYTVRMRVTDTTGETLDFNTSRYSTNALNLNLALEDGTRGSFTTAGERGGYNDSFIKGDVAVVKYDIDRYPGLEMEYKLLRDGKAVKNGKASESGKLSFDLSGCPSGYYELKVDVSAVSSMGKKYSGSQTLGLIKVADDEDSLNMDVTSFFRELDCEDGIALQIGATDGPVWAVAEAFVNGNRRVGSRMVKLSGEKGKPGSLSTVRFSAGAGNPESMSVHVLFFRDGKRFSYNCEKDFGDKAVSLPLNFTRFIDKAAPGSEYRLTVTSEAGIECAATVFDLSSEAMQGNWWPEIRPMKWYEPSVEHSSECGSVGGASFYRDMIMDDGMWVVAYGASNQTKSGLRKMLSKTAAPTALNASMDYAVAEESASVEAPAPSPDVAVREDFATTICWEPFLRPDRDGNIDFSLRTSDKLSTFVVQLFAHDKAMRNRTLRREMVVTIPVRVNLVQPQYLYEGDRYVANVSLASNSDAPAGGKVSVIFYDGDDYRSAKTLGGRSERITVPANGNASWKCGIDVPAGIEKLGVYVLFEADGEENASDAMFVPLPVIKPLQTVTEAHSALLKPGMDRAALEASLRSMFVNIPGSEASVREIPIRQMLAEALPEKIEARSNNVIDLADAWYANVLAEGLGMEPCPQSKKDEMLSKIRECRNLDGGYGWFSTMYSSQAVTAALLLRNRKSGGFLSAEEVSGAVKYLDSAFFGVKSHLIWCGMLSMEQYMYVRAMYAEIPFSVNGVNADVMKEFRKDAKDYLVPAKERGLNGRVYAKSRRLLTLRMLLRNPGGLELAKSWGISASTSNRLAKSLRADIESILQYAVEHKCGGWYYPNLVMPYRGLLDSELEGHAMMCDLLEESSAPQIAEGIRLWIMVQKESQHWESDPAYVEALGCVYRGTEETLSLKVLALSGTTTLPFAELKASGNGFTVERKYFIGETELKEGDPVRVGDRIRAEYRIWNEENRSFVKLVAPRPAALRPVDQLSGRIGWWLRPLNAGGWYSFSPQGYRSVFPDRTEFWFDSYPEDRTTVREEFFVTQEGCFSTAAATVESLYAPHYRANENGRGPMSAVL